MPDMNSFTQYINPTPVSNGHIPNGYVSNEFRELVQNRMSFDRFLLSMFGDRRRNIEQECGYKQTEEITPQDYQNIFDREPVAARVCSVFPMECFQMAPRLFEDEDIDTETEFEAAWTELGQGLLMDGEGEESWFKDENINPLWGYLLRGDIWSGIGSYGVILFGIDDGKELSEEADLSAKGGRKLTYLRVLSEVEARISAFDSDPDSPRYGKPSKYAVTMGVPSFNATPAQTSTQGGVATTVKDVHWSRIQHIVDNPTGNEVGGIPRMQQVYNRLYDLHKMYGGSAEMYWQGAFPGISFETHPQLGGDVKIDLEAMRGQLVNYQQGLQRWLSMAGMAAKTLSPQVVDPTPQILTQIEAICILLGIPKRVFMGSERGELSSNQDIRAWYARVQHRQQNYLSPFLIARFVNRLIRLGCLPIPQQGYGVAWPDLASLTKLEKAQIGTQRAQALSSYMLGGLFQLVTPRDFFVRILGFEEKEAEEMVQDTEDNMEQMQEAHLEQQVNPPEQQQLEYQADNDEANRQHAADLAKQKQVKNTKGNFGHAGRPGQRGGSAKSETGTHHEYQQTLEGEYWIQDGQSQFADGDIGEMNHEGYAIQHAQMLVLDQLSDVSSELVDSEYPDWDGVVAWLDEEHGDVDKYLKKEGVDDTLWDIANGVGDVDPRAYAAEHWGWIRVHGNNAQMRDVTQLKELGDGIADAHQEADLDNESFTIETKTGYYTDVPWSVIDGGKAADLREYKSHGTPGWGGVQNAFKILPSIRNAWSDEARRRSAQTRRAHKKVQQLSPKTLSIDVYDNGKQTRVYRNPSDEQVRVLVSQHSSLRYIGIDHDSDHPPGTIYVWPDSVADHGSVVQKISTDDEIDYGAGFIEEDKVDEELADIKKWRRRVSNAWSEEARKKALESRRRNKKPGNPPGAGAKKLAGRLSVHKNRYGQERMSPAMELQHAGTLKYDDAAKVAKGKTALAKEREAAIADVEDIEAKMSQTSLAGHNHFTAAEHHKIASGLTQDAHLVAYHSMQARTHEKKSQALNEQWKVLQEQRLNAPKIAAPVDDTPAARIARRVAEWRKGNK